ncbi:hypothetical protein Ancab_002734 [Ancistrocladus abbreviatus]
MMKEAECRKRKRGSRAGKRRKKPQILNSSSSTHRKNNIEKDYHSLQLPQHNEEEERSVAPPAVANQKQRHWDSTKPKSLRKPSNFLDKARARLSGGHFRMINEKLYTCTGNEALNYFKEDPSLFDMYHAGYQEQMSHWPELPVNIIIKWLKDHSPSLVVADFGCGDARLAKNVKNKVFSIDLVSSEPSVIACDMANTPLGSSTIDVVIFCLSLMGTDFPSYLQEAHRVLKPSGWLLIAEVKSRFDPNTGGADPNRFAKAVCKLGFTCVSKVS